LSSARKRSEVAESKPQRGGRAMRVVIAVSTRNPVFPPFIQKSIGLCPYFFGHSYRQKVGFYFLPNKKAPFIKGGVRL
jgi:hypothetical protein